MLHSSCSRAIVNLISSVWIAYFTISLSKTNGQTFSATDPADHAEVVPGTTISLDNDSGFRSTLIVGVSNHAEVTFTVSGLGSADSGTMTFDDLTGKSDVGSIGSNGTYSTKRSNLTNSTLTYLMTVSDPAGNVINPTAALGDGSANAPAGSPQVPTLLNGYTVRPPWMVAGVDYAVGVPSGTALQNPLTINTPGVSADTARHLIRVEGNNITLSGYDFTGWTVYVTSGSQNTTIQNSYFGL